MKAFQNFASIAAPLLRDNVDTDAIIPSREMKSTGKTGFASGLFAPWRYIDAASRTPNPDFILNQPDYGQAQILLAGINFGCGSSREHAVWALAEYGMKVIIAESFAPIFYNNCIRNGILPIQLERDDIHKMAGQILSVNLGEQRVNDTHFDIDTEAKTMLLEGLDAIDMTMKHQNSIQKWLAQDKIKRPYIYFKEA
ncbi:3-isopropylmalate dehydratase small subunit [Sphingorhabdus lutea]|uniref:3-isopropylmalate dehydratase small subunit n=1 Tax=Sphingorhabdus lutea TaxID=1913578 RepID=A0A1L3J974_9SPHN|nr:3-isopropylmalate dehydratase small subunit [Sphingorhabdus lutea]APG61668.1 3-isopropylmalate dehydratase small subunit [Sphingorhabdus lutea]